MRTKPTTLPIGTISEGTLRPEDLISAFLDALDGLRLTRSERQTVQAIKSRTESEDYTSEDADFEVDDLTAILDILENHVPDYCYFGTLEGDGACFGVWPCFEQGVQDGEIVKVNAGDPFPAQADHVLSVTDHGNCTLYRRAGNRWREVWAIV